VEIPKIEVYRPSTGHAFIHTGFPDVVAVASDVQVDVPVPWLHLNDVAAIADFVKCFLKIQ
jgi:molybdopterin-guanine dinucleotide biosynthesis protein B